MRRWLYAYTDVAGSPAQLERTLLRDSIELLHDATRSTEELHPAADGSYRMSLRSTVAGLELVRSVRVRTGVALRAGSRVVLPLTWYADMGRRAFPAFEGALELEALSDRGSRLSLVGSYRAPLGPVGAAADAALLRNVGQGTAQAIVDGLAAHLAQRASAPQVVYPSGPRRGQPLRVGDVMTEDPLVVDPEMPLRTTALLLFHAGISGAPVVSGTGELVGVITEGDLLVKEASRSYGLGRRAAEEDRRRGAHTAGQACSAPALTTVPDALVTDVARTMLDKGVNRLVVLDQGRVAGIITRHDVQAALIRHDADIALAVRSALAEHGEPGIEVAVQWGEVELSGEVHARSTVEQVRDAVLEIDGVVGLDVHALTWNVDDMAPPFVYM